MHLTLNFMFCLPCSSVPTWPADSQLKSIILINLLCIYNIPRDDGLQICPKHVEVDWRNKLSINSASSWFSLHRLNTKFRPHSIFFNSYGLLNKALSPLNTIKGLKMCCVILHARNSFKNIIPQKALNHSLITSNQRACPNMIIHKCY